LIWKPIELHLENIENIYFSPDGLLHKIPFAALRKKDEPLLSKKYNLVQLSTTANIETTSNSIALDDVVLIGGIDYEFESSITNSKKIATNYSELETLKASKGTRSMSSQWNYLPGTLSEVNDLQKILNDKNLETINLTKTDATEKAFLFFF